MFETIDWGDTLLTISLSISVVTTVYAWYVTLKDSIPDERDKSFYLMGALVSVLNCIPFFFILTLLLVTKGKKECPEELHALCKEFINNKDYSFRPYSMDSAAYVENNKLQIHIYDNCVYYKNKKYKTGRYKTFIDNVEIEKTINEFKQLRQAYIETKGGTGS